MSGACCTCASLLASTPPIYDEKIEKPARYERRLDCCGRAICGRCITDNPRFAGYCPFCQISSAPSSLPQGLRDPPPYSLLSGNQAGGRPPPYSPDVFLQPQPEKVYIKPTGTAPDVLHFVDAINETVSSISLRYGVPVQALRRANGLYADHLLAARRTILIPREYYKGGVSLSPRPLEGEEEEIRKGKVRKFMVGCKVPEYDVALLYLQQAEYDLGEAISAYKADEKWEREHPFDAAKKGKFRAPTGTGSRKWGLSGGFTGQL